MRALLRGERNFAVTFWLWLILPLALLRLAAGLLVLIAFTRPGFTRLTYQLPHYGLEILSLIWAVVFGIAAWRAAGHARSHLWGIAARVAVGLIFAGGIFIIVGLLGETELISPGSLAADVKETQNVLPQQEDPITDETALTLSGGKLTYSYVMAIPKGTALHWDDFKGALSARACQLWKPRYLSGSLDSVEFDVRTTGGAGRNFSFDLKSCP